MLFLGTADFATGFPGDASVVSGMRRNSEVAIYADVKRSMEAGVVFFQSANGVVLTDGINARMPPVGPTRRGREGAKLQERMGGRGRDN